jgi:sRNA-binding protein
MRFGSGKAGSAALAQAREMLKAIPSSEREGSTLKGFKPNSSKLYGEANQNAELDEEKVKEAMKKVNHSNKQALDDRKRKYNSVTESYDVTEEEMEAYRRQKEAKSDDPMAKISSDKVLDYN